MKVNFNLELTEGQKKAWELIEDPNIRYIVLRWSRQCGKTVLAECAMIKYLFIRNTYNIYISPSFQLGRKVYGELIKVLYPTGIIKKANASTLTIETIYDSTLQFHSMEAYASIRGTTVNGICILDECAYYPDILPNGEEPWGNIIMPICKARKPKVLFISTPRGKRGILWEHYLRAKNGEEGYAELSRTIYDDELVTKNEIEEIKKSIPDLAFRQEFMVEFIDSSLTFFIGFENCFKRFIYQPVKEWIGVDLSGNGSDETIVTKINAVNQVKQYKIEGTLDMKYQQIAKIINEARNCVAVYMENNGLGAPIIGEVKKLVTSKSKIKEWTTTNSSKEEIISELAVKIANKDITFDEEEKELFSQFGTFIVKISKTKKMVFGAQDGKKDDRIMSLAIALRCKTDYKFSGGRNNYFTPDNITRIR